MQKRMADGHSANEGRRQRLNKSYNEAMNSLQTTGITEISQ
jgi:hypothetical protein